MGKEGGPPCHPALVRSHSRGFRSEKSPAASCSCRCLSQNIPSAHVTFQVWPKPGGSLPSPLPVPPGPWRGRQPEVLPPLAAVTEPISLLTGTWAPTRHPLPWILHVPSPTHPAAPSPLTLRGWGRWGPPSSWGSVTLGGNNHTGDRAQPLQMSLQLKETPCEQYRGRDTRSSGFD